MLGDSATAEGTAILISTMGLLVVLGSALFFIKFRKFLNKPPTDLDWLEPKERDQERRKRLRP